MPNYVSPGVYTIEKDISDYTPSINTSIVGVVGFASKGPTNKATLITSQNNLIDTFGSPSEDIQGQGLEGALEILEQTNSLYYVRAVTDSVAEDASATMSIGSCPALVVSGGTSDEGWGVTSSLILKAQVYDSAGNAKFYAPKQFTVPAGTASYQGEAIRKIVGGGLDSDHIGCFFTGAPASPGALATGLALSGAIAGSYAGSGAYMTVSACSGTTWGAEYGTSALRGVYSFSGSNGSYGVSGDYASAITVHGASVDATGAANSASYKIESLYPGAGYNGGVRSDGTTSGNSVTVNSLGSQNFNISINQDGTAQETFKCSFVGSGAFVEDVINTGELDNTSEIIKGNLIKDLSDATAAKLGDFTEGLSTLLGATGFTISSKWTNPTTGARDTISKVVDSGSIFNKLIENPATNLAGGDNGIGTESQQTTALIGDATQEPKTGMQAFDEAILNIGIALAPGVQTEQVQNSLVTLAENTQNFLALVAPPYSVGTTQDAIDWTNGKSSSTGGSRTSAINSSYAAVHWPWVKTFSIFDSKDIWLDPSIYAARQMAYTDSVSDSWFAPAGYRRGRLTKPTEVEVKLNQGDRDSLYSGGNVVNPIVAFPQQGITIFGQRTTQRSPTALDRINVRRLMIYIRKIILASTQRFVFEPNDEFTWAQIEGVLNPFLDDIRRRRGITEFRVVCDETVNTPVRIDRNELWTKVLIKPTKTAEILIFEINLTNQSAQLGNL